MIPNLAQYIDHTLLKPEATRADALAVVAEAAELGAWSVCLSPSFLPITVPASLHLTAVVGFPSGKHQALAKASEAALAVAQGAHEIDMVIDIGAACDRQFSLVEAEIRAVRSAVPRPTVLKVIVESAALHPSVLADCCRVVMAADADFVKTSTGFHPAGGASVDAVRVMKDVVGRQIGIKASGGIRTLRDAEAMLAAGATRLGLSGTRAILEARAAQYRQVT